VINGISRSQLATLSRDRPTARGSRSRARIGEVTLIPIQAKSHPGREQATHEAHGEANHERDADELPVPVPEVRTADDRLDFSCDPIGLLLRGLVVQIPERGATFAGKSGR
jgi:hypothetical protein